MQGSRGSQFPKKGLNRSTERGRGKEEEMTTWGVGGQGGRGTVVFLVSGSNLDFYQLSNQQGESGWIQGLLPSLPWIPKELSFCAPHSPSWVS